MYDSYLFDNQSWLKDALFRFIELLFRFVLFFIVERPINLRYDNLLRKKT